jgi:hypothetical protein
MVIVDRVEDMEDAIVKGLAYVTLVPEARTTCENKLANGITYEQGKGKK